MRPIKRAAALSLGALLALSVTACGGGTAETDDPQARIQAAMEKLNAAESMEATMTMEMDMTVMGQTMESDTIMEMVCFTDPMKLKADMTMDMGDLGSITMTMYAQEEDGQYTSYLYDGSSWISSVMDLGDLEQYDAQQSMDLYIQSGADYAHQGTEEINGVTADKYTGVIRGDALEEVLAASGAGDSMSATLGETDLSQLYSDLGDLSITVWVDSESGYPVRCFMDMTALMDGMMDAALAIAAEEASDGTNLDVGVAKLAFTIDCSAYNSAADFDIPEEALAAAA